jgi:biopolymer transport protein ExbD
MAGGGTPTPSSGGKKSVDFVVNLVPTIDLLSVLISFLLITAVWTQLARINTGNVLSKASVRPKQTSQESKPLKILVDDVGIRIRFQGENPTVVSLGAGMFDRFRTVIAEFKKRTTDETKVVVAATDGVPYHMLIEVMDACLDVGLAGLSVGDPSAFGS